MNDKDYTRSLRTRVFYYHSTSIPDVPPLHHKQNDAKRFKWSTKIFHSTATLSLFAKCTTCPLRTTQIGMLAHSCPNVKSMTSAARLHHKPNRHHANSSQTQDVLRKRPCSPESAIPIMGGHEPTPQMRNN